jgi:hypothetical protein
MSPQNEQAAAPDTAADGKGGRVLLCPEEWQDPTGRKVIDEFHKEGLDPQQCKLDPEALGRSDGRSFTKMAGEYHKEGAPYMEPPVEGEVRRPQAAVDIADTDAPRRAGDGGSGASDRTERPRAPREPKARAEGPRLPKFLNVTNIELASLAMFRALIGKGVHVPIRVPNGLDMDVIVKDRDIILNTNKIEMIVPELRFWHITYAYKGRPVVEMGRGVEGRLRLHYWNALVFLLAAFWGGRRSKREMAKAARRAKKEEMRRASGVRSGGAKDRGGGP